MRLITILSSALILLVLTACTPPSEPTATKEESAPAATTQPETPAADPAAVSSVVSTHYIDAATALAADDLPKAKAALTALARESTGEMKTLAQAAADTGDIAATRERFKPLSALVTSMELPPGHAVAYCPMYKGGAKWVQKKDDKLANPYYGSQMLTCGNFVN
jgi:hypothetical protein